MHALPVFALTAEQALLLCWLSPPQRQERSLPGIGSCRGGSGRCHPHPLTALRKGSYKGRGGEGRGRGQGDEGGGRKGEIVQRISLTILAKG